MSAARVFTCPARYRPMIESAIALAMADVGRDMARRSAGDPPTIRDSLIDGRQRGELVVVSCILDREQQAADAAWPNEPAAAAAGGKR